MKLIIACATDDGRTYSAGHFGEARYYVLYEMTETTWTFLQNLSNTSKQEKGHADPEKAKNVMELLAEKQVQVAVATQFGPNIGRIKQHVVPVLVKAGGLDAGCAKVLENRAAIIDEFRKGAARSFLVLP